MIVKLVINQYSDALIKSSVPALLALVITQRTLLGIYTLPIEQAVSMFAIALLIIRFAADKYKLVKDDQMPYLIPSVLVIMVVAVLIGSMFSDVLWGLVGKFMYLLTIGEKSVIGTTVAEQMPGTWNDIVSRSNVGFARTLLPIVSPFDTLFSIWFLMIMGSLVIVYHIYKKKDWMLLFPLLWLVMSVQTVFYMVRLNFFLGPPAAIVAGYFVAASINWFSKLSYMKKRKGVKKLNILSIPVVAVISALLMYNLATGYVFCNSVGPSYNTLWDEAMTHLKEQTPVNASVLSWWDFGYWFQTKGERPSTADGGNINGSVNEQIADWYTANAQNWTDFRPWLKGKDVSYILMDYTLPGKYGAISKIGSRGKQIIGMLQMQRGEVFPQENRTIVEFRAGQYTVWLPVGNGGNIVGAPIFMISQGGQYVGRTYLTDICTENGILRLPVEPGVDTMPGCLAITAYGMFYIPPEAEFSIFTNLMFMDGYGIPDVEKVFDNEAIIIYKLQINESASVGF